MAKDWRTIKFTYNSTEYTIDALLETETMNRNDLFSTIQMLDGTIKRQITGENFTWEYSFDLANTAVKDFFVNAYDFNRAGGTVVFDRENDDGTFTQYSNVIISRPQWQDLNITSDTGQKVFSNLIIGISAK